MPDGVGDHDPPTLSISHSGDDISGTPPPQPQSHAIKTDRNMETQSAIQNGSAKQKPDYKAEQGESSTTDSNNQVLAADDKNTDISQQVDKDCQVLGKKKVEQSDVCEAHSDDVVSLPSGDCSSEADKKSSMCEKDTQRCVAESTGGLQSNIVIKSQKKIQNTRKPFTCDLCGVRFTWSSHLSRHKRTHTREKPYNCDVCSVGFAQYEHLKDHQRIHTGDKPYKCDVCGVGFIQCGRLITHIRIHTGEKPFKCDVCGLGFARNDKLKSHEKRHSGVQPHKCDVCGVGFDRINDLKRHKILHTGKTPFKCDMCDAGFTQSGHLDEHKKTHIGKKPHKCDVCGAGFTQSGNLKRHKKLHSQE